MMLQTYPILKILLNVFTRWKTHLRRNIVRFIRWIAAQLIYRNTTQSNEVWQLSAQIVLWHIIIFQEPCVHSSTHWEHRNNIRNDGNSTQLPGIRVQIRISNLHHRQLVAIHHQYQYAARQLLPRDSPIHRSANHWPSIDLSTNERSALRARLQLPTQYGSIKNASRHTNW